MQKRARTNLGDVVGSLAPKAFLVFEILRNPEVSLQCWRGMPQRIRALRRICRCETAKCSRYPPVSSLVHMAPCKERYRT